jgi:hypothetical protein
MICLIRQPAGLGDVIFTQKIAKQYIDSGYEIHWPISDVYYETVCKYFKNSSVNFYRESDEFPMKDYYLSPIITPTMEEDSKNIYLPLQHADRIVKSTIPFDVMSVKYKSVRIDSTGWQEYFEIDRDMEREDYLFYDVLKLTDDLKYNIVNRWFGTGWDGYRKDLSITNDLKVVEMENLEFDNIFDWCKVYEKATEIHTVETAICYILEKLNLKADRKCLYSRNAPQNGFSYVESIYTNINWEFIL